MDTLAHGLWATAVSKSVNIRTPRTLRTGGMALWGILPDLFSFTPVVVWMIWQMSYNGVPFSEIPRPEFMSADERKGMFILRVTQILYNFSHSTVIFTILFVVVWLWRRYRLLLSSKSAATPGQPLQGRPYFEMSGWLLHILLDIPTHSAEFYPTLFLWPLSEFHFDGNSWGNMPFMTGNYLCLMAAFIAVRLIGRKAARKMLVKV
jgi:hypothetical protein